MSMSSSSSSAKKSGFEEIVKFFVNRLVNNPRTTSVTPELEVRFTGVPTGEFVARQDTLPISKTNFNNVSQQLVSSNYEMDTLEGKHLLRIYLMKDSEMFPFRCEISGMHDIQIYCRTNDWSACTSARFVRKMSVPTVNNKGYVRDVAMGEYGFKVSLKDEISIPGTQIHTEPLLKNMKTSWTSYEKAFRQMNRTTYSRPGGFVLVDMSVVKSSAKTDRGQFTYVPDINNANLYDGPDIHEIEIEFNHTAIAEQFAVSPDIYTYIATILADSRETINAVLCGINETLYPITQSEMKLVLLDYYSTIYSPNQSVSLAIESTQPEIVSLIGKKTACNPSRFIGPSAVSLQFENIVEDATVNPLSIITSNYAVSDKADGERCLMFIGRNKNPLGYKVYLLDMNLRVRYTGMAAIGKKDGKDPAGTIIDGEYIRHDKFGANVNMFLAFDIYVYRYKNVKSYPFIYPVGVDRGPLPPSRCDLLRDVQATVTLVFKSVLIQPDPFRFSVKPFLIPDETHTIFDRCREVLAGEHEYTNDGLVFAHQQLPVGGSDFRKAGPNTTIRWEYSFKWKPPQFNTVDFLVTSPDKDAVHSHNTTGTNPSDVEQIGFYKKLELRCGFQFKSHGFANALETAISEERIAKLKKTYGTPDYETAYIPMLFYPSWFPSRDSCVCNVMVNPDHGAYTMMTEEGHAFDANTIIEFRYDPTRDSEFRWVPIRVRDDKTARYLSGQNMFGNDYVTANNVWKSIHMPITEEIITTGRIPNGVTTSDELYEYYQMDGDTDSRSVMQMFHNHVKTRLLDSVLSKNSTLIDLSCGRGGDLYKWIHNRVKFVFGIDFAKTNIENRFSGAYVRYLDYRLKTDTPNVTKCLFVTGDSSKNIKNGDALSDEISKQIASAVYGNASPYDRTIGELYGMGNDKFNVASCQFSLHYFFKDLDTLGNFMINVSQNVKMNGTFVATCFDGRKVFDLLASRPPDSPELFVMSENDPTKLQWRCTKLYSSSEFRDDSSSLGYGISVFQRSIGKPFTEYLVNKDYLQRVMEQYGFALTSAQSFEDIFRTMPKTKKYDQYRPLGTMPERMITFLNIQYVFTKVSDVDPLTVVLENLGSLETTPVK
jgi:hypothetical protein